MNRVFSSDIAPTIERYTGSREDVLQRYVQVLANLGMVSTEAIRRREITGMQQASRVEKATHLFGFPAEHDAVLTSKSDENLQSSRLIESKSAPMSLFVSSGVGVELDMTAEPPVLNIYDVSPLPEKLAPELRAAIFPDQAQ